MIFTNGNVKNFFDFNIENYEKFDTKLIINKPIPDHALVRGPKEITDINFLDNPGEIIFLGESKDAIKVTFIKHNEQLNGKDV